MFPRSGAVFDRAVAACVLPLSPQLERLQKIFESMNLTYAFLVEKQVQMTSDNAMKALRAQLPQLSVGLDDVMLAAALVPEVLVARTTMATHGSYSAGDAAVPARRTDLSRSIHPGENGQGSERHLTETPDSESCGGDGGGGSLDSAVASQGWRSNRVDGALQLGRMPVAATAASDTTAVLDGGGTTLYDNAVVTLELIDPGRYGDLRCLLS